MARTVDDAGDSPNPAVVIRAWRLHKKNTLQGFLTVALPSGMILHDLTLHQRDEKQWIGMPAREWANDQGEKQYSRIVEFVDRAAADRFQVVVLEALNKYLENHHDTCE
jgi:DNA-binding cell septation regulator SpoVG